jgi:hypothetical protein
VVSDPESSPAPQLLPLTRPLDLVEASHPHFGWVKMGQDGSRVGPRLGRGWVKVGSRVGSRLGRGLGQGWVKVGSRDGSRDDNLLTI